MGLYRKIDDNRCVNIINKMDYKCHDKKYFRLLGGYCSILAIRHAFLSCTLVTSLNFSTISGGKNTWYI